MVFGEDSFAIRNDRVRVVHDLIPNRAAAGGLYTGLSYSTHSKSFVVACDMPFLNPSAIKYLITLCEGFDITSVQLSRGLQTMHGIYSKSCLPFLQKMVKDLKIEKQSKTRLITEMQKQGIIEMSPKGFRLTALGKWYVENCL